MDYQDTLDYMYRQLPMFHRIGKAAYKANLNNALALDSLCGYPHRNYKTIHVAGTNGKGSVSHMLAAVLQSAGYKTGLFTSPHLVDFRERIRVNGCMIPEVEVTRFIATYKDEFENIKPSFFEMTSALAFDYFSREKVDIAVIETGMGGRLDSTNIITPVLSVITNIGLDHTEFLGDTPDKIAAEKAGIIKPGVPVVIGETHAVTRPVFEQKALMEKSEPSFADQRYITVDGEQKSDKAFMLKVMGVASKEVFEYMLDLQGHYQRKNICTVLCAVDELRKAQLFVPEKAVIDGLKSASAMTGLLGRWQILAKNPLTICDTGHNYDGISQVVMQLNMLEYNNLHIVFGVVNDKDITGILPLLPVRARYYFTKADIPRALPENDLKRLATAAGLNGDSFKSVSEAIQSAKKNAVPNDLIFIGGSTFIVADALKSGIFF